MRAVERCDATRPEEFQQRVLAHEAPGGPPARLDVVIPTVTRPGEPVEVRVAVLDGDGYPSLCCRGTVRLRPEGHGRVDAVAEIDFEFGVPAVGRTGPVSFADEGFHRLVAEMDGLRAVANPTRCSAAAEAPVFWGDPHVHTILSNCHPRNCRTLNFCYTTAEWLTMLDWVAAADHVSNGRCDLSKWLEQSRTANLYNRDGAFVTIPAYEASLKGGAGGDNNVYMSRFPDLFVDAYADGTVKTLCEKLTAELGPGHAIAIPHHTTRTGKHGEIPPSIYPGPACMPAIEIHSKWGTSEYRGNPNPLRQVHGGPCYAVDLLNQGLRLAFVAGTDTHATMPSGYGIETSSGHLWALPGLTAVRAQELSRQAVFGAMRDRTCYAASGERVYLDVRVAGTPGGGEVLVTGADDPRLVEVTAAARSSIASIDLVRNGSVVHRWSPGRWRAECRYADESGMDRLWRRDMDGAAFAYYYVRVTCQSGAQAWSSPVWLRPVCEARGVR